MEEEIKKVLSFFERSADLKSTLRYVYLKTGRQESTAEHTWQLSLMVPIMIDLLKLDVDVNKSISLAIVHDLPEAITGDIDAIKIMSGEFKKERKQELETEAIVNLKNMLPVSPGQTIFDLWHEYEAGQTEEAKFIKALDKLETTFQLSTVSKSLQHLDFLATYPDQAVSNFPQMLPVLKEIKIRLKAEFVKNGWEWKSEFDYGLI